MNEDIVKILDGNNFIVSDRRGDVDPSPSVPTGLFSLDTRFLSLWRLSVDGQRLHALSVDDLHYFEARFFLVPGEPTHYVDAKISVIRQRTIGGSFDERLTVLNHQEEPVDLTLRIDAGCDFADIFEIKDVQHKKGHITTIVNEDRLRLIYERQTFRRETVISVDRPAQFDEGGLTLTAHVKPHGDWVAEVHVETIARSGGAKDVRPNVHHMPGEIQQGMEAEIERWLSRAPILRCDSEQLDKAYETTMVDLAALRFPILTTPGAAVPAAGLPWFMALFGRDSIITSYQALPFTPELANTTLRILALLRGAKLDDFRDEEPGKILHENRYGESAAFEEQPHSPYYGTADATPLFVVLLDEYERWTGDAALVRELEDDTRAALRWIDEYGDLMGNGYISYKRRNNVNGLENQCWKDSWDAITFRDGTLPGFPRATCELQGYAYDAKMRGARLAREFWNDPGYADQLETEAGALRRRFNRDFWVEDGEYYALALDQDGRRVDSLSSNIGHLLWSGIVEPDRAPHLAAHLTGPRMFSGWGVRTLAEDQGAYNPVGYHVGTVWPFDNSLIAAGLARYGFREEAGRIALAMIDASQYFDGRLPEAFAGYHRSLTKYPVEYPTACSPQAWSAGTPLLLLRTMLGLEPYGEHLVVEPSLPEGMGRIELFDLPGRWGRVDAFARGRLREQPPRTSIRRT
ncbi:glycogen debranching N-terminal domain-containing protein [Polymorphospora lycopeni]|uniref:Glycogen debranching N-terminal domain-containing protein n=1 Tax=Polymorphospora lycopeni TaxID=3140240 RepID=A0ABV5CNZ7_9ACTN